jgi:hypothetical protein
MLEEKFRSLAAEREVASAGGYWIDTGEVGGGRAWEVGIYSQSISDRSNFLRCSMWSMELHLANAGTTRLGVHRRRVVIGSVDL